MYKKSHNHNDRIMIDYYSNFSKIRDWNTNVKLSLAVFSLLFCIGFDSIIVSITTLILTFSFVVLISGLDIKSYINVMKIPIGFLILSIAPILLNIGFTQAGIIIVKIGQIYITTSESQIWIAINLFFKALGAVSCMQMLILTTPMHRIIISLNKFKIPKLIVDIMYFMYRFIFIFFSTYTQMKHSAKSRNGYKDFFTSCKTFGNIMSNLFVSSLQKLELYNRSMDSRCYTGRLNFYETEIKTDFLQIIVTVMILMLIFLSGIISLLLK